jgi:hypothetical protein
MVLQARRKIGFFIDINGVHVLRWDSNIVLAFAHSAARLWNVARDSDTMPHDICVTSVSRIENSVTTYDKEYRVSFPHSAQRHRTSLSPFPIRNRAHLHRSLSSLTLSLSFPFLSARTALHLIGA